MEDGGLAPAPRPGAVRVAVRPVAMAEQLEAAFPGVVVDAAGAHQVLAQPRALRGEKVQCMRPVEGMAALIVLGTVLGLAHRVAEKAVGQAGDFHPPVGTGGQGVEHLATDAITAFQGDFPGQGDQHQIVDAQHLKQRTVRKAVRGHQQLQLGQRPLLFRLAAVGEDGAWPALLEKRQVGNREHLVTVGGAHGGGAHHRASAETVALRLGQLENVHQAACGGGAQARRQVVLQTLEQRPGLVAERLADTPGFQVAAVLRMPGRVVVGVGGLKGAVHEGPRQFIAEAGAQALPQPVPDVRVIGAREGGNGGAVDGKQRQRAGGIEAAIIGLQVDAQHGHARIHRAQGVVLAHFFRVQIVIARPGLYRAVTGQAPDLTLTGGESRRASVPVGADHRLTDALAEKGEQLRVETGAIGAEGVVKIAAEILSGPRMGVRDQQAQPPRGHVRGGGDAFGHGVMQRQ